MSQDPANPSPSPNDMPPPTVMVAPPLEPMTSPQRRFATFRTIMAMVLREMSSTYGRSPGGYVWAVLEPLGAIVILAFGFSLMIRAPSLGNSFILFYATGFLPFQVYQTTSIKTAVSLEYARGLLSYPAVTWFDTMFARILLNTITSLMVVYLLMTGILVLTDATATLTMGPIITSMCLAILFGSGVGMINCVLSGLFPVWRTIWSIITRPLFLASGVIFTFEDLPRFAQDLLWFNPIIHVVGLMREGTYSIYTPDYISVTYVLSLSLVLIALGTVFVERYYRDILQQ